MLSILLVAAIACIEDPYDVPRDCEERSLFHVDADGDGLGDPGELVRACQAESGLVPNGDDCDDSDAGITTECHDTGDSGQDSGLDSGSTTRG